MSLTINDVLTRTVRTISPDIMLAEAAGLMSEHRISCLVAVESDKPVGILTEADLVQIAHLHIDPEHTCISEFLSAPVISIEKDQSIYDAFDILLEYQVRHLVVVHADGRLKGILTFSDMLKAAEFDDFLRVKPVRGVMSCQVVSAAPDTPLDTVLTQMDEQHLSCMVALDGGTACGIFTERDVARLLASDADIDALKLADVMTSPLVTMAADDSMLDAVLMMRKHGFRRVVIVDAQQHPVGIVTQFDVIRGMESKSIHHFQTLYDQMEGQLVVEKMELERIVGASPAVLYRREWRGQGHDFVTTYISRSVTPMLGYERHECLAAGWWIAHIHPDDARLVEAGMQTLLEQGEVEQIYRFADKSGDYHWIRDHACLHQGVRGKPGEVVGSWLDITESRRRDQQVYESEELYRSLVEQAFDGIAIIAADGRVVFANEACAAACGAQPDALIGMHYLDLVHPDEQKSMQLRFRQRMDGNGPNKPYEARLVRKNGDVAWVEMTGRLITWHDHPADLLTMHDITERKRRDALLARQQRQLAVLAKAGKTLNETLDQQQIARKLVKFACALVACESGAVGFCNGNSISFREYMKAGRITPVKLDFLPGCGVPGHVMNTGKPYVSHDARHDARVMPEIQQALGFVRLVDVPILDAERKLLGCFEMHDRLDGQDFDDQDLKMLQSLSGIVAGALVNAQLLAVQRQNQQRLEQAAKRMRTVLDADFDAVIVHQNFQVVFANAAALKMFGFTREQQALGVDVVDFVDERYKRLAITVTNRVLRTNKPVGLMESLAFDAKRNKSFPIEIASAPILWHGDKAVVSILRDISQRKQAEAQMRLLESAVGSVNESIIITDARGTIVYVNSSFTSNTGFEADYAIGKTPAILNSKQQSKGFYEQFWGTLKRGEPWAGRILDRKKDGTIFPVHLSVAPIFDDRGEITHFVAVHEDLTRAESLQSKMIQTQKMEALGTMVGGVAHDFNNMLASIIGNFYLIRMRYPDDAKLQQRIRSMEQATRHGAELIQQMLTFARRDHPEMQTMQLSSFIKEAHKLAGAAMPENIKLELHLLDTDHVCVKADATQLQQVLLNLVTNARHAVQDIIQDAGQGYILIEVDCRQPPAHLLQENPEMMTDRDWCCIRCVDNGSGIKADDMEHVFEPFFTTKGVGEGTGLGMAMVYGAVQNHRGLIDIDSTPGKGTTVSIWLPQYRATVARVVGAEEAVFDGGGRTILLVDDEGGLRTVLAEVLEHNGFTVLQACDGEQAVAMFRASADQIAIVLMDVVMPNKGGVMAAQEIRQMDAHVPIIFQTGYGEQTQLDAAASITHSAALQKPVLIPELLRTMMAHIQGGE